MKSKYLLLILTILLAACHHDILSNLEDSADLVSSDEWSPEVLVTRNNGDWPEDCEPADIANSVIAFMQAFNEGDQAQLEYFFSGAFTVFSQSEADGDVVEYNFTTHYDADVLMPYFQEKYEQNEQWRLNYLRANSLRGRLGTPPGNFVNIEFGMTRLVTTSGEKIDYIGTGKGVFNCNNHTLGVWSAGTNFQGRWDWETILDDQDDWEWGICPAPKDEILADVVIVCTAH